MENVSYPESPYVVRQSLCTHESKPILLGYMIEFYSGAHVYNGVFLNGDADSRLMVFTNVY